MYDLRQLGTSDKASYVSREIAGGFDQVVISHQKTRSHIFCYFMSGIDGAQTFNIPHQAAVNTHHSKIISIYVTNTCQIVFVFLCLD